MTVHARKQGGNDGQDEGRTPALQENGNKEDEDQVVRAVDLTNEELKKLLPELVNDAQGMAHIEKMRDVQKEHDVVFEEYIKEKRELELRFEQRFSPLFEQRRKEIKEGNITDFWSRAISNCDILASNITERDAVCMEYLDDLWVENITKTTKINEAELNAGSFILHFKFRENPYFRNEKLTKTYAMGSNPYDDFPEARGCEIEWKTGKNLTTKTFRKKNKKGKIIVKQEEVDTFFNFFNPPDGLGEDEDMASDIENVIEADVELGEAIRNDLIPRALYYYLGLEEPEESDSEGEDNDGIDGFIRAQ